MGTSQVQKLDETLAGKHERRPSVLPVRIAGVSKTFVGRTQTVEALRSVDLEVAADEFVYLHHLSTLTVLQ